jgi:hypothetical protein
VRFAVERSEEETQERLRLCRARPSRSRCTAGLQPQLFSVTYSRFTANHVLIVRRPGDKGCFSVKLFLILKC